MDQGRMMSETRLLIIHRRGFETQFVSVTLFELRGGVIHLPFASQWLQRVI